MSNVPAPDFGNAAVVRYACDKCGNPVLVDWRRREDDPEHHYCSKQCRDLAEVNIEEEGETTMTEENVNTSPIAAGTATAKASKKKAAPAAKGKAKTAAPAKKGAARAEHNEVLTLVPQKADAPPPFRADRQVAFELIKDGMTISQLQDKAEKKLENPRWRRRALKLVKLALEKKLIKVSKAAS